MRNQFAIALLVFCLPLVSHARWGDGSGVSPAEVSAATNGIIEAAATKDIAATNQVFIDACQFAEGATNALDVSLRVYVDASGGGAGASYSDTFVPSDFDVSTNLTITHNLGAHAVAQIFDSNSNQFFTGAQLADDKVIFNMEAYHSTTGFVVAVAGTNMVNFTEFLTSGNVGTNDMDATADAAYRGDPAAWWYATMSAAMLNIPDSVETPIAYDTIAQTNGCNYNTTTYTATNIPNGVYMFMLQVRIEDMDTQKWGRFTFNPIGGFPLTAQGRYHEPENSTADLQNQAFESVYVVTNGNGACYASWKAGDPADDNDITEVNAFFSGIRIHDWP